jgi:cellobiose epimerase
MNPQATADYLARIEDDLRQNILPFWIERVADRERRSFLGSLTNDLLADPAAERGALLTSRILWTYSAAYGRYRNPDYLAVANHAYADLIGRFLDPQHGGFRWSVSPAEGTSRDRKQVYGQAFAAANPWTAR